VQLTYLFAVEGDECWTAVTGLTTDVPNIETIREAAVCQKKRTIMSCFWVASQVKRGGGSAAMPMLKIKLRPYDRKEHSQDSSRLNRAMGQRWLCHAESTGEWVQRRCSLGGMTNKKERPRKIEAAPVIPPVLGY